MMSLALLQFGAMAAVCLLLFLFLVPTRSIDGDRFGSLKDYIHALLYVVCAIPVAVRNVLSIVAQEPLQGLDVASFPFVGNGTRTSADYALNEVLELLMLPTAFAVGVRPVSLSIALSACEQQSEH